MLNSKQLEKLNPLIQHKIFGSLLKDAIEKWQNQYIPKRWDAGLSILNNKYIARKFSNLNCCLIGSALLDKSVKTGSSDVNDPVTTKFYSDISIIYNLTLHQVDQIVLGFDSDLIINRNDFDESFLFGHDVAKIVFE